MQNNSPVRVYQAQVKHDDKLWTPLSTKSGGTICNTLGGAKSKLRHVKRTCRVISYELSDMKVEQEHVR